MSIFCEKSGCFTLPGGVCMCEYTCVFVCAHAQEWWGIWQSRAGLIITYISLDAFRPGSSWEQSVMPPDPKVKEKRLEREKVRKMMKRDRDGELRKHTSWRKREERCELTSAWHPFTLYALWPITLPFPRLSWSRRKNDIAHLTKANVQTTQITLVWHFLTSLRRCMLYSKGCIFFTGLWSHTERRWDEPNASARFLLTERFLGVSHSLAGWLALVVCVCVYVKKDSVYPLTRDAWIRLILTHNWENSIEHYTLWHALVHFADTYT